jgi:hypothetical protein
MTYYGIVTFGGSAIQITSVAQDNNGNAYPTGAMARRVMVEPLRANTHAAYVGLSNVTNNGTGIAIQELAVPASGSPLDRFLDTAAGSSHNIDPSIYYVHGFSGEKVKVTIDTI